MKDILEEIVAWKRHEVEQLKRELPEAGLRALMERTCTDQPPSMSLALRRSPTGIIAEFKRKSPSKGWIREDGRAEDIPADYQKNGAAALSILTDSRFFGGEDGFIAAARRSGVTLPVLYKNFVIDEYQLFRARLCGASAVLLIAACLSKERCSALARAAHSLGLEVLLEMHSEPELEYTAAAPDMCGINNRNLGTFVTDTATSFRLGGLLPADSVKVSESGISSPETVRRLRSAGFSGFLIGEHFMKAGSPGMELNKFINAI